MKKLKSTNLMITEKIEIKVPVSELVGPNMYEIDFLKHENSLTIIYKSATGPAVQPLKLLSTEC